MSEIADALAIPQSSSSILLQALNKAGFIDRNRSTRKYLPSIRSVFLGSWTHDTLFKRGSLLHALGRLSDVAGANVRLGVRNGIHAQYVHVSWPSRDPDRMRLRPGMLLPICQSRALRVSSALQTGQVAVNECLAGGVETPFGGYKQSGHGREKGVEALHHYTQLKCVTIKI